MDRQFWQPAATLVLLALSLVGCVSSSAPRDVMRVAREPLTHFGFSADTLAAHKATPLGTHDWMFRRGEARVPVFDTGTPHSEVIAELRRWRLEPIRARQHILVEEGPSRHGFGVVEPRHVIYAFDNDALTAGPLGESELAQVLYTWGLESSDFELLATLDLVAPLSAGTLNDVAWFFATYHDASKRVPALALILASRSNAMTDWEEPAYLDTMAAACAAAGDMDSAVDFQLEAVLYADGDAAGMADRLALYEGGQAYVEPRIGSWVPPDDLVERADGGNARAQFELGMACDRLVPDACGQPGLAGIDWLQRSAQLGFAPAVEVVASGYVFGGYGLARDHCVAKAMLEQPGVHERPAASYLMAVVHQDGECSSRDEAEVSRLLQVAAAGGMEHAAVELGYRMYEGLGVEADSRRAHELWAQAAAGDYGPEQFLAVAPESLLAEIVNEEAAAALPPLDVPPDQYPGHLMEQVASIERQLAAGQAFASARFVERRTGWLREDAPAVIYWLTKLAARFGSAEGQRKLAALYAAGHGVQQSEAHAAYWRQRAEHNVSGL